MAVDKRIPRVLNSDADSKTINKVSMLDALNVYSGPDNEGLSSAPNANIVGDNYKNDSGNGVLKNIRGTEEIFMHPGEELPVDCRVIGSVEDVKTDITYFFVYSNDANNQGVWAYDKNDILNTASGGDSQGSSIRLIYKSNQFNFPQNGFVKADIVYTSASKSLDFLGDEFDKDVLLYFTDGVNEPRKLNTYRAFVDSAGSNIYGDDIYAEADFICACPRVPLDPITFSWENDESRSVSNFSNSSGFKFAYQYLYKDGTESAISPYSDVAFPPSVVNQGAQTYVDHSLYNSLKLFIPSVNTSDLRSIRVLAKEGASGSFAIIDEIDTIATSDAQEYVFRNDRISRGVPSQEENKQFDSIPRSAVTQAVTSNRLMYGNYVDGFDNVETNATVEPIYRERGAEFKTFEITARPSISPLSDSLDGSYDNSKTTGFQLDCSNIPDEILEGTVINFSLTLIPDNNWHFYEYKNGSSYHQSKSMGVQDMQSASTTLTGANVNNLDDQTPEEAGVDFYKDVKGNIFGKDTSLSTSTTWSALPPEVFGLGSAVNGLLSGGNINCTYGTSAGNPLILQGGPVSFKASIRATSLIESDAPSKVADAIEACLTYQNATPSQLESILVNFSFELATPFEELQNRPSYSIDLGLQSGQTIGAPFFNQESNGNPYIDLIVAVKRTDSTNLLEYAVPIGYFIVNKATPTFYCESVENDGFEGTGLFRNFRVGLFNLEDTELITCMHDIPVLESDAVMGAFGSGGQMSTASDDFASLSWVLIDQDTIDSIIGGELGLYPWLESQGLSSDLNFATANFTGAGVALTQDNAFHNGATVNNFLLQVGFLNYTEGGFFSGNQLVGQGSAPLIRHCVMDGEGGMGGGFSRGGGGNDYDDALVYEQGSISVNPFVGPTNEFNEPIFFDYSNSTFLFGTTFRMNNAQLTNISSDSTFSHFPLIRVNPEYGQPGAVDPAFLSSFDAFYPEAEGAGELDDATGLVPLTANSVNYNQLQSYVELFSNTYVSEGLYLFDRSFKTEANHDFGIVYYDQRGRHGFVNHLDTVFINGYNSTERQGNLHGAAHVKITIFHDPPSWAHHYKIVYSGNTSVRDFVQYSSGGAFVEPTSQSASTYTPNIYVSLNYLQGHPVSYVSSFGARTPEGGLNFYKFEPGDKLRVISYGQPNSRQYPPDYEFEVVDLVNLGTTENPLVSGDAADVPENKQGEFVVLRNNLTASGFTHADVEANSDFWDENTIIELRTPEKEKSADELIFYEIGETYDVVIQDGEPKHDQEVIEIQGGDVWFRPVATNVRTIENGQFIDIIKDEEGLDDEKSKSNFSTVLLETKSASDLFRSDNSFLGRPNVIFEDSSETRRESTITYSEPTNPEGLKVNYSNFNASLANFKDLSERYGGIQYMGDHSDYVVVIQKERVTIVPVNKNILSDASGSQQIVASTTVLNEAIVYPGVSGCDDDPSSVYDSGDEIYFCNKSLSKVYKWTKNGGAEDITAKGMSSFIRACIQKALSSEDQIRVVGGYDPLKREYLLSIQNLPEYGEASNVQPTVQPDQEVVDPPPPPPPPFDPDEEEDTDTESDLPPLVVIPDPIVFNNIQFGPGVESADGSLQSVSVLLQANQDLNITDIQFSDDRFSLTTLTGAGSVAFPIAFLPEQGINVYPISISYSPDTVDEVSAEIEFTTNLESHPSIVFDIDATATFVAGDGQALPDEAFSLAEAFNDYYNQTYTAEDMSAQLAIEYLQALAFSPVEDQPTGNQIKSLLNSVNQNSMKRLVLDTYGDNNNAVGDSTDGLDFINLIGANGVLGDTFDPNISIFQDNETFSAAGEGDSPPPLSNNPPPNFETVEEAVQYLEQNRVLRVHDIARLNKYSNPNIVLNVVDRFGIQIINNQDLLAVLSAFGTTMNGMDSPYGNQPTDYDTAEYTGSQVIDQIVTEFYDVITVEQYHRILNDEYPDPNTGLATSGVSPIAAMVASMGAYLGYYGANYDYYCQIPTLLFFLSQFGADNGITLDGLSGNPEIL